MPTDHKAVTFLASSTLMFHLLISKHSLLAARPCLNPEYHDTTHLVVRLLTTNKNNSNQLAVHVMVGLPVPSLRELLRALELGSEFATAACNPLVLLVCMTTSPPAPVAYRNVPVRSNQSGDSLNSR